MHETWKMSRTLALNCVGRTSMNMPWKNKVKKSNKLSWFDGMANSMFGGKVQSWSSRDFVEATKMIWVDPMSLSPKCVDVEIHVA